MGSSGVTCVPSGEVTFLFLSFFFSFYFFSPHSHSSSSRPIFYSTSSSRHLQTGKA